MLAQPVSNHAPSATELKQDTGFFVASSFLPDKTVILSGLYEAGYEGDDIFHPVMAMPTEYNFTIFNRWRQNLFSSKELYKGWNGYYKDRICEEGVYFWKVTAITTDSKKIDRQGSFHLLIRK